MGYSPTSRPTSHLRRGHVEVMGGGRGQMQYGRQHPPFIVKSGVVGLKKCGQCLEIQLHLRTASAASG